MSGMSAEELHASFRESGASEMRDSVLDNFLRALLESFQKLREDFDVAQVEHIQTVQEFVAHKSRMEAEISVLHARVKALEMQAELDRRRQEQDLSSLSRATTFLTQQEDCQFGMTMPDSQVTGQHREELPLVWPPWQPEKTVKTEIITPTATAATRKYLLGATGQGVEVAEQPAEGEESEQKEDVGADSDAEPIQRCKPQQPKLNNRSLKEDEMGHPENTGSFSAGDRVWVRYIMPESRYHNKPYAATLRAPKSHHSKDTWRVCWFDSDDSVRHVRADDVVRAMTEEEERWVKAQVEADNPFVSMFNCERHFRRRQARAAEREGRGPAERGDVRYEKGDRVEGQYEDGKWYAATVLGRNGEQYELEWADGDETDSFKFSSQLRWPFAKRRKPRHERERGQKTEGGGDADVVAVRVDVDQDDNLNQDAEGHRHKRKRSAGPPAEQPLPVAPPAVEPARARDGLQLELQPQPEAEALQLELAELQAAAAPADKWKEGGAGEEPELDDMSCGDPCA